MKPYILYALILCSGFTFCRPPYREKIVLRHDTVFVNVGRDSILFLADTLFIKDTVIKERGMTLEITKAPSGARIVCKREDSTVAVPVVLQDRIVEKVVKETLYSTPVQAYLAMGAMGVLIVILSIKALK